jgi:indole-3-acetate monooxygenase
MATTLRERVEGLAGLVEAQVPQMEEDRRLTDDVVAGIRATGLNRAWVPGALGGDERHVIEVMEAIERIAAFDGSTGWCAAIGCGSNLFAGYLPEATAATVWADPDQGNAGMFGPFGTVRASGGGLELTGRWPFCSNSLHSEWIGLGAFWFGDAEEAEPVPRLVLVSMDDVTIETTWDSPGLCATGSHHASVDGAATERDRSVSFVEPAWAEGPLWRLPLFCLLAPGLGVAPLGIARGALDEISAAIEGKVGGLRGSLADDPVGLADFAEADTALRGARAGLWDACARAWESAERGERVPKVLQAQVMLAMSYGCQVAVDVTSTAHRLGGGRAAYAGSSLLRRLRDVQTARQHIMFGQSHRPMFAKTLAGEDTFAPPFIV